MASSEHAPVRLYTYFRSSAAYRVRIALNVKGLAYESEARHLKRDGGEHRLQDYRALNPQALIPALQIGGTTLSQSLAIIEYLDESYPQPLLLPKEASARAMVRSMALSIACDMHPLNNLRVLEYLRSRLHQDEANVSRWYRHWIAEGFGGLEEQVARSSEDGRYCFGSGITLADVCLVPQVSNARRFQCDLSPYPALTTITAHLESLDAFVGAAPERQPDAE